MEFEELGKWVLTIVAISVLIGLVILFYGFIKEIGTGGFF